MVVSYRGEPFTVSRKPTLAIDGKVPWCVDVAGAWYQLGFDAAEAADDARRFFRVSMRSKLTRRTPVWLATHRYPLLLSVDGVAVRAYPFHVAVDRWPVWIFESPGRTPSDCGTIAAEQSLDDVIDLAKIWIRSDPPDSTP